MKTVEGTDFELPAEMEPILREYAKKRIFWMNFNIQWIRRNPGETTSGLGKTLQVIAFLLLRIPGGGRKQAKPDRGACSGWYLTGRAIRKFAPALPVQMVVGKAERKKVHH